MICICVYYNIHIETSNFVRVVIIQPRRRGRRDFTARTFIVPIREITNYTDTYA